ncbi:MAG TPA: 23S rRNA (adenine(2503)-C(2))-methyltransferase RlmN [Deltaproteobacteria bacterium]|nr:23S rRNA (adenine(2503)-C(2))-methyltransferase RlmN [Deltaproteobacteria bacterium]HIJ41736.1 23S rRNA (adenine(2503)-C(2))-methyltransferase RlmN [Deltaproteobacteria bacterium]
MLRLLELTYEDLAAIVVDRYEKGPFLARALYREFYKNLEPDAWRTEVIRNSQGLRDRLRQDWLFSPGQVKEVIHQEGVVKFVTELADGNRIESVILPMKTHQTVCISSQAGCGMGCRFCETGKLGLARSLSVEEIVGQVYIARQKSGQWIRNVVFMGMGEPFDNFENVIQAVRVLSDQRGLDIAQRHITLSTAGRIDGIEKLAALHMPHLNLTVSLNAPNDGLRRQLMPVHGTVSLALLQKALMAYPLKKGNALSVAYVLISHVNDGCEHAQQLAEWLKPLTAKVNLIPFNPGKDSFFRPPNQEETDLFRQRLIELRVNVQKRLPRGRELMAACGQLGSRT